MRTDELAALLATGAAAEMRPHPLRGLLIAAALGLVIALGAVWSVLGFNPALADAALSFWFAIKVGFTIAVVAGAFALSRALLSPMNAAPTRPMLAAAAPFGAVLTVAAGAALFGGPEQARSVVDGPFLHCLIFIPLFALAPFALLTLALRDGAPADPAFAGAAAGLLAGALSATAYAFYCPVDAVPYVAVWYGLALVLCARAGGLAGARLLRW